MAEDGSPSENFKNNNRSSDNSHSDGEDGEYPRQLRLDLGDDFIRSLEGSRLGNPDSAASGSSMSDTQKREDNPFSFKHFLRGDFSSHQNKGARPKVYCEGRPVCDLDLHGPTETKQGRVVPEFSSALPDFVQDHLVIEQCYLGNSSNSYKFDVNNLPDFTPNSRTNFDPSHGMLQEHARDNSVPTVPLDLPLRPQAGFPLDLPIASTSVNISRSCPPSEVGNSKSLPDFLADSAVCAQKSDGLSASHSPEEECDRLRRELDLVRRQLSEQTRRVEILNSELEMSRSKENEFSQNLIKALEEAEENVRKSNRRASTAENSVFKLKQEIKSLTVQINYLKDENKSLHGEEAAGGHGLYNSFNELHSHRLAQELRAAASSAENSLRQLLTGVDNLRMMASSLENLHRIEEKTELDHEDSGPTL